jgi:hypothetical protein
MIDLPDFLTPLRRIAGSVEKMTGGPAEPDLADVPLQPAGPSGGTAQSEV